jgi:hypothetical protein
LSILACASDGFADRDRQPKCLGLADTSARGSKTALLSPLGQIVIGLGSTILIALLVLKPLPGYFQSAVILNYTGRVCDYNGPST